MKNINCIDIALMAVDSFRDQQVSRGYKIDAKKLDDFKQYCIIIDRLADEFDGESFEVEIDTNDNEISATLICGYVEVLSSEDTIYKLFDNCLSFETESVSEDALSLKFVFPSVWVKG